MGETVKLILTLSISGGLFTLALFALKPLMRNRLSKSFQYYIWLVVLLRFILPFSFGINLMDFTFNASNDPQTVEEKVIPNNNPTNPATVNPTVNNNAVNTNRPIITEQQPVSTDSTKPLDLLRTLTGNLLWIWLAGAVISVAWNIHSYLRFTRYVHGAAYAVEMPDCDVKVYKSRFAPTPMLIGVIKPRIYLPDIGYTDGQLNNILLHELTHLRRCDVLLKWFATLVVSVHWFNPIAYFMRREFNRACELSCDEAVIRNLDGAAKQNYGDTLISVVAEGRYPVGVMSVTMCEEKTKLKERLIAIMNYKKKTKFIIIITALLAIVITGSALVFGSQGAGFSFQKPSYYTVDFPYNKISDIRAEEMLALILNNIDNRGADVYMNINSQQISLNTDYTLIELATSILVSEYKNGEINYRPYQILISNENNEMMISPGNYTMPADTEFRRCSFITYWNAISFIPINAISKINTEETPDYFSLRYTQHDSYVNSSQSIKHIFYDGDSVINHYRESPSAVFDFTPMYQDENDTNSFSGIGTTLLYFYNYNETNTDNIAMSESFNISLAELRQLAAKGDELMFEDFSIYEGQDVGFGLFILHFKIEGGYELLVGGGAATGKPMYATLKLPGVEENIDIRYDDIDEFIGKYPVPNELSGQIYGYLDTIMSSPLEASSTGAFIKAHQAEYDTILYMGVTALPTLTSILNNGDKGLRGNIAALLVQDIVAAKSGKSNSEWLDGVLQSAESDVMRWSRGFQSSDAPATSELDIIQTLDDAVEWYLNKIEAPKYLQGEYFVSSYRILDTQDTTESITIYTHILCEWISIDGESVSGGAGLVSITLKKHDNVYEYEKSFFYHIPDAPELPQKVKDIMDEYNPAYFAEMRSEVDKDIAKILESHGKEKKREITSINVDNPLNWNNMYPRKYTSSEKIATVLDYIDGLKLKDKFPENPNEYDGSTSTITVTFDDGTEIVYYHFGNMFFGKETESGIDWKRMEYEEAEKFESIIRNNLSD